MEILCCVKALLFFCILFPPSQLVFQIKAFIFNVDLLGEYFVRILKTPVLIFFLFFWSMSPWGK